MVSVNDHKGTILADETREGFHIKSGERRKIEFHFSTPIENENSEELYAGFTCDQHISVMFGNTGKNLNLLITAQSVTHVRQEMDRSELTKN